MINKYFTVTKKISIPASVQHAGVISAGNLIADWQPIQVPKGVSCLRNLTLLARPKGNSTPTTNIFNCEIYFAKTDTFSLGTVGGAVTHFPMPDVTGFIRLDDGFFGINVTNGTSIASTSNNGNEEQGGLPLILEGDPNSGDNVGLDTIYVGIISNGNWNWGDSPSTANAINEDSFDAGAQTVITLDGTTDIREHFAIGDVLHAQDDAVIGTVATVDSTTQVTLTAANTDAIENNDNVYNLHPLTLVLGFEK
tara:strand:- start:303 stop:1058 length:756 start_codon:yes stop_codon:yes gene_type:complete